MCTSFVIRQGSLQEVIGWGLIGWKCYANVIGPIQSEGLATLGVTQIACAEKRFLILSRNGRVYSQAYNSDTLVGVPGLGPLLLGGGCSGEQPLSSRSRRGLIFKLFDF